MSRYLFVPFPAHGHVNPMLPVVAELAARGADVRVAVPSEFVEVVRRSGTGVVELPVEFEVYVPDRAFPLDGPRWFRARTRRWSARKASADVLRKELGARPADLVVVDTMASWAGRVAKSLVLPQASFSTTFTRRRVNVVNAMPELQPGQGQLVGPLIRACDTVECELPWKRIRESRTLLVSPGTVFARKPEFFRWIADAFAGSDWLVVAASGPVALGELGALPENVIVRRKVPQLAVLAHAQAFVTHGGMNSVLESLAAGVPMLLAPRSREQRATSRRLRRLGVGVELALTEVRQQVERVSGDLAVQVALGRFRGLADTGFAGVVADFLQGLTAEAPGARTSL
ncbi:glycosyltransferase [Lentzea sp. NPDC102401]|uniref:glycosyltransferase n=1 Tax=Lentzea sp. NPDC102401 TaxID=3364128 RepID=UPI0038218058